MRNSKGHGLSYEGAAQWSPDGLRLIFIAYAFADHVWTIRANGRDLIRRG